MPAPAGAGTGPPAAGQDGARIAGVGDGQRRLPQQHDVGGGPGVERLDLRDGGEVPIDLDEGVAEGLGHVRGKVRMDLQPALHLVQGVLRHVLPPVAVAVVGSEQRRAGTVAVGEGDAAAVLVDLGHCLVAGGLGGALDVVVGLLVSLGLGLSCAGVVVVVVVIIFVFLLLLVVVVFVIRIIQGLNAVAAVRADDVAGERQQRFVLLDGMADEPPPAPGRQLPTLPPLLDRGGPAADHRHDHFLLLCLGRLGVLLVLRQAVGRALHVVVVVQPVRGLPPHVMRGGRGVHDLGLQAPPLLLGR